ncbi:hypothetical protein Tco_1204260 [Tanacetum coccineum]
MVESSSHNPSSPKITPKEEPVTLDKPESPNPFLPADQIEFSFDEIAFATNNEAALLYPSHPNSEYFREYTTKTLDDSKIWVSTPTGGIREDIGYSGEIGTKGTLKKSYLPPRVKVFSVHNWALKPNQTEGPSFTDHIKAICKLDVPVDSRAPKPSSQTEEVPQGKKPGAKMVGEMHKETQQAAGGPTSLGATSEEGAHPQLSSGHDASADSTAEVDPELSAPNDSIPSQQDQTKSAGDGLKTAHTNLGTNEESRADEISKKIKMEDLSDLLKDTTSAFFTPDSPQDEPIIVSDESEEEETKKAEDTHATSHNIPEDTSVPHPPSPKSTQIQELMAQVQLLQSQKYELEQQKAKAEAEITSLKSRPSYPDIHQLTDLLVSSLKPEFSKLLASHDFASCLPTELNELPSKFTELSGEIKELKKHEKLKTLDSLPSLLNKVTDTLNRFATVVKNASGVTCKNVPSTGKATASPTEGEKNTNPATRDVEQTNLHNELVDLLGIDIMTQCYSKKLLYDKYCDKMLKRRKSSKIINCDVLIQKGHITLQVYREDGTVEVISNVKVSDLHLAEWKEVVQARPDRKEKGWKTIYG